MKTYPRTCKYCGKDFKAKSPYQMFCKRECNLHQIEFDKNGTVTCAKCGRKDVIDKYSKQRVCKNCGKLLCGSTLDEMTPDELLHYGKVQASKFYAYAKVAKRNG